MTHERFRADTLEELLLRCRHLGIDMPSATDLDPLARQVSIGEHTTPNALAVHPMEGCDGTADGRPDYLTYRRYERFARGGAGLLWFEATAVVPEGRANPRQLWLNDATAPSFRDLLEGAMVAGREANGAEYTPVTVLQLTHSGRYSRPVDAPAPMLAHHDGILDAALGIPEDAPLVSDDYLQALQERYVKAARLAYECGFDAVDIKSCHRYLISELLAAHTRRGRYGGSFEGRTRFLRETVSRVREAVPEITVTVRLNVYDGHRFPWGWGVTEDENAEVELSEPVRLVGMLRDLGVAAVNVTAGNPYFTPHINRPFDRNVVGAPLPQEHPLVGVARLIDLARRIKASCPEIVVVGTGYTWLRQHMGPVAAGVLQRGWADLVGLGRGAFAYPDFAQDLLVRGSLDPKRVCTTCSSCTQVMRDHGRTGCVVRDRDVYGPIYAEGRRHAKEMR